jgi:cytochrome c oxidase accessory protein FixG
VSEKIPTVECAEDEDPSAVRYVNAYESEGRVYIRKVSGFYQKIRRYTGLPLMAAFLWMPWFLIDGRPAMLFDLPARKFHILWLTFWPQDSMLLAWLLIIAAFMLFTVTVLVGRVWCGFTCPQTVWTHMFVWAEHLCEGGRNKRIKLDQQPMNLEKFLRKSAKHSIWISISLITAISFVGYFTPIRDLIGSLLSFEAGAIATFWVGFFTVATFSNAGYLREQVCKYMCPYARFQAVMYDEDTLAVHYDKRRGENRGPRKSGDDYQARGMGDCIDCSWCVQVCPVDIDIRDGLQYECINCGLCVDACNTVMDKMSYQRGLIRFASEDELNSGHTKFLRPRLYAYCLAVVAMVAAFAYTIATRVPVSVDVIRDRGARLYRVQGEQVQNVYTVKINNMDRRPHTYLISLSGDQTYSLKGYRPLELEEGEVFTVPIRVSVPRKQLMKTKNELIITVTAADDPSVNATEVSSFIGPKPKP